MLSSMFGYVYFLLLALHSHSIRMSVDKTKSDHYGDITTPVHKDWYSLSTLKTVTESMKLDKNSIEFLVIAK